MELDWLEKCLASKGYMVETREHKPNSGRLKVYVYETRRQGNKNIIVPVADVYYSRYSNAIGSWLVVARLNWKNRLEY